MMECVLCKNLYNVWNKPDYTKQTVNKQTCMSCLQLNQFDWTKRIITQLLMCLNYALSIGSLINDGAAVGCTLYVV